AVQIPRIARDPPNRIERMASSEFRHVRLGQWDCTIGAQCCYGAVICRRAVFSKNRRAIGGQLSSYVVVGFDGHWQPREPARIVAVLSFKALGMVPRFVKKADRQGIDLRLYSLNARYGRLYQFQWRKLAFPQFTYSFARGQTPQISH